MTNRQNMIDNDVKRNLWSQKNNFLRTAAMPDMM